MRIGRTIDYCVQALCATALTLNLDFTSPQRRCPSPFKSFLIWIYLLNMETLTNSEVAWRDNYEWLLSCGYQLRPRLRPGWVPSWISNPPKKRIDAYSREDSIGGRVSTVQTILRVL